MTIFFFVFKQVLDECSLDDECF